MPFKTGTLKSFKVLFGAGKSALVFPLALLIALVPLSNFLLLPLYITLPILFFALLLPILYVPALYNLINNSPIVVFGRYHLPLFFSSVIGAIFVAVLFNISPSSSLALKTTLFLFSTVFITLSGFVYSYVYSAINVRINEGFKKLFASAQNAFLFLAMTAFSLCFLYFYNEGESVAFGVIGYVTASIMLLGGTVAYFASYKMIPKLVRVTLNVKRGIKESFLKFYSPLLVSENHRTIISYLLFCLSIVTFLLSVFDVIKLFELSTLFFTLMLLLFCFSYCIASTVFARKVYVGSFLLACVSFVTAITLIVMKTFSDYAKLNNAIVLFSAALIGLAAGLVQNGFTSDFSDVVKRSNTTLGTVLNIKNTINCVSIFISICLYSLFLVFKKYSLTVTLSFCVLSIIASFCVKFLKKKYLTLQFPTENEHNQGIEEAEEAKD